MTTPPAKSAPAAAATAAVPRPKVDGFDADSAMEWARRQVALGPRPAGSDAQRAAADLLVTALPNGHFVDIGDGLRNIVGRLPDGTRASRSSWSPTTTPRPSPATSAPTTAPPAWRRGRDRPGARPRPAPPADRPVRFLLSDGEEAPACRHATSSPRACAAAGRAAHADRPERVLLDFIARTGLRIPREAGSDPASCGSAAGAAANRSAPSRRFPAATRSEIQDDHTPFACARDSGDRPDRLRLPVLAAGVRHAGSALHPQPRRVGRDGPGADPPAPARLTGSSMAPR